jgi:photosystem II stability/assembly factor-like uncharacterized protein
MTFFRPLFRATMGGLFFLALVGGPLQATGPGVLAVDRAGDRWVAVGEKGRILLSENRWETWRQAESPVEVTLTAVRFLDHRTGWAVGHEGVILKTEDGGGRWRLLRSDPAADEPLFDVLFQNPAQGMAVGAYGLCLRTEDGGTTWTNISLPSGDRHLYGVASPRPGVWVVVGEGGTILRSSDGGRRWKTVPEKERETLFGVTVGPNNSLAAYGFNGAVWVSRDAGVRWKRLPRKGPSLYAGAWDPEGVVLAGDGTVLVGPDPETLKILKTEEGTRWTGVARAGPGEILVLGPEESRRISPLP